MDRAPVRYLLEYEVGSDGEPFVCDAFVDAPGRTEDELAAIRWILIVLQGGAAGAVPGCEVVENVLVADPELDREMVEREVRLFYKCDRRSFDGGMPLVN